MTKQTYISHKLKANLKVLLTVCFVLLSCPFSVHAQDTIKVSPIPSGTSYVYRQRVNDSASSSSVFTPTQRQITRESVSAVDPSASQHTPFHNLAAQAGDAINEKLDRLSNAVESAYEYHDEYFEDGVAKEIYKFAYRNFFQVVSFQIRSTISVAKTIVTLSLGGTNRECNKARMDSIYKDGCYSCEVVSALLSSFMASCTNLYGITKEVGHKILFLGFLIWIAFFVLQQISSFRNIEPASMIATMLTMAFKVLGAYVVIGAGIDFFISYAVLPFMQWGMEFGNSILGLGEEGIPIDNTYAIKAGPELSAFANNMQSYMAAVNYSVSTHMEIGHLITCHSTHAGTFPWGFGIVELPNIWLWISGAFIWLCGFMMTYAVAFYLLDISFKLGFSIIALPVMVGLWPFNVTKQRLSACFGTILRSAGILIFLSVTVFVGLTLITNIFEYSSYGFEGQMASEAITSDMSGTEKIIKAIEEGDNEFISEQLSFFNIGWLLIVFAYLFANHIIGATDKEYAGRFFPNGAVSGTPMHGMLTQATAMAQAAAMKPVNFGGRVIAHQSKKAYRNLLKNAYAKRLRKKGGTP